MKQLLLFILFVAFVLQAQAQKYSAFKADNGKYGYKDSLNVIVIEPEYEYASDFSHGLGIVYLNKKCGAVDSKGTKIIPLKYQESNGFHEGLAGFKLDEKWGYLDKSGNEVIPFKYEWVREFSDNVARVSESYKKGYVIDRTGKKLFDTNEYFELNNCVNGLLKVRKDKTWGCIDKTGKEVIALEYDNLYVQDNGFVAVSQDRKWGLIDNNYRLIIPMLYQNAMSIKEGLAAVKLNDKWGFVDNTGKVIIPFQYDEWWGGFAKGIATVKLDGEKFEIDKTGKRKGGPAAAKPAVAKVIKEPVKKPLHGIELIDTVFATKGIKLGFPKGYKFSSPGSGSYMTFYKPDSSIMISLYGGSGFGLEYITAHWEEKSRTRGPDDWYKNIGLTPQKDFGGTKTGYISDYYYPFTFGGADFIWMRMVTKTKGTGLKEFEAVKASLQRRPVPLIEREVIPGHFSMKVPAYLEPATGSYYGNLTIYTDGNNFLRFKKDENKKSIGSLDAMLQFMEWKTRTGFKQVGKISVYTTSEISFSGFYGLEPDLLHPERKSYEAYVFFNKPGGTRDCWLLEYRLGKGIPENMQKEMEEFLKTAKVK